MTAVVLVLHERLDEACVRSLARGLEVAIAERADAIVLEGSPGQFCLGMDFTTMAEPDESMRRTRLLGFAAVIRGLLAIPIPTLAVVVGPALGGGLGLAAACDYVLATDRARFGLPEALYGLAPAIIRPALLGRLTPQRLRMLVVTCGSRTATEGLALGLADELVGLDALAAARMRALRQLRRANPATVAALRRWGLDELDRLLAAGVEETATSLARPEVRAAILAEDPPWL
ncbi:MAG: enoyl-CoA hydratase-related protein [Kofleriaceae bacterium]